MAATRNKYNTLTPAEAKKLSRYLSTRQPPVRTASVLHKPRPPPMVVTDLDSLASRKSSLVTSSAASTQTQAANTNGLQTSFLTNQSATTRSSSSCSNRSYRGHRHSMNLGNNFTANNRYATINSFTKNSYRMNDEISNKSSTLKSSPNDSESNLSFRSSLDIVDSAYGSDRIQTMSVDLGYPAAPNYNNNNYRVFNRNGISNYSNNTSNKYSQALDYQLEQQSNKISDESFSSAKSHQSDSAKLKSLSKMSLSTSTSRVFQNQLCNLKKFFRYMPMRRSLVNNSDQKQNGYSNHRDNYPLASQPSSLEESLSQLCLNRSQSPPVCPPPPGELKSMSYMENSLNYSNYDDFTQARNKQTSTLLATRIQNQRANHEERDILDQESPNGFSISEHEEVLGWQLTSLPLSYERNLTTVFEEKQNSIETTRGLCNSDKNAGVIYNSNKNALIKPPENFEDKIQQVQLSNQNDSNGSSSQSLTSSTTADSILDYHRQTNTSFRFSYSRPSSFDRVPANSGLPPKMPISEHNRQGTSTGGSSSNSSLTTNGISNCDQNLTNTSAQIGGVSLYGYKSVTDNDTTLTSDTSTLHGDDTNALTHTKKCAELELEVTNLGNKLSTKEKELRELQLKLWSSDYLIDQLKSNISRLEKENAQLKAVVISSNRVYL